MSLHATGIAKVLEERLVHELYHNRHTLLPYLSISSALSVDRSFDPRRIVSPIVWEMAKTFIHAKLEEDVND